MVFKALVTMWLVFVSVFFYLKLLSLIHNSPKWRHCVIREPAAFQWCIYCPMMLKFERKSKKIYVQTHAWQPFENNFIITGVWHWISFANCCCSDRIRPMTPTNFALRSALYGDYSRDWGHANIQSSALRASLYFLFG